MNISRKGLTFTLLIYVLYSLQGILYTSGSWLSQGLLLIFLLIGLYGFISVNSKKNINLSFVKIWSLFFVLLTITFVVSPKTVYGITIERLGVVSTFGQYKSICFVILTFFAVFHFSLRCEISEKYLFILGVILIITALLRYFLAKDVIQQEYGRDFFQNNGAYYIVSVIPFLPVLFKKSRAIAGVLTLVQIALVIGAAKRGAIVCLLVSIFVAAYYLMRRNRMSFSTKIIIFLAVIGVAYFVFYLIMQNEFLLYRLEDTQEGNIGSRDIGYSMLWNNWLNSDIFHMMFGYGLSQTITVWGNTAHNDWLELLTDNGLLGVIVYLVFYIKLFKYIATMKDEPILQLGANLAAFMLLTKTIFSMGYTDFVNVPILIAIGIYAGMYESKKKRMSYEKKEIVDTTK